MSFLDIKEGVTLAEFAQKICEAVEKLGEGMEATLTIVQQLTERVAALEGQVLVTEHGDRVEVHHHPKPEKADAIT